MNPNWNWPAAGWHKTTVPLNCLCPSCGRKPLQDVPEIAKDESAYFTGQIGVVIKRGHAGAPLNLPN